MAKIIQGAISPGFGGLELVIIEFHEWLKKQGADAHVFALQGSPLERELLKRGLCESIISIPKNKKKWIQCLEKYLESSQVTILFHRQQSLKELRFKKINCKISILSHTFYNNKKKGFWHRLAFSKVHQWIVLTQAHKKNLLEMTSTPSQLVKIIPNGVNIHKFKPHFKTTPTHSRPIEIGVIARLDPQKGQEIALMTLKELLQKTNRLWRLHFYGEDTPSETPMRPKLEILAKKLEISENVVFHGYTENLSEKIS